MCVPTEYHYSFLVLTDEFPVRTDTVLEPVKLPAGEANLTAGLAEVDGDTFPRHREVLSLSLWRVGLSGKNFS